MAKYELLPALKNIFEAREAAAQEVAAENEARLAAAPEAIAALLPGDVVGEGRENWTLLIDPATGLAYGLELRLYLTDGTLKAPLPLPGFVKIVEGVGVQLFLGSDPLPLTALADWGRETPLRSATAAYETLLEMRQEAGNADNAGR